MNKITILLSLLVFHCASLNFKLIDDKQFCMRYEGGKKYTLEYVISGVEDENVRCTITQGKNDVFDKEGVSEQEFTYEYLP